MADPYWLTAFLDLPADRFEANTDYWRRLTGSTVSVPRGPTGEFATLEPPDGDAYLKVQRIDGPPRIHLDVHVADVRPATTELLGLGATVVADHRDYLTLTSPGGFVFCLVDHPAAIRPAVQRHTDGRRSRLDQLCLDIPPDRYAAECDFWGRATGWELRTGSRPEFSSLVRPDGVPLRLLLQRLDHDHGPVGAHLDWACSERGAEADRHRQLGGTLVGRQEHWTVLRDPAGLAYCCTDRDPVTGLLP